MRIPDVLPILPLKGVVIYPTTVVPLSVDDPRYGPAIDEAMAAGQLIGAVAIRPRGDGDGESPDDPQPEDLYLVGTAAQIHRMIKAPDGSIKLLVQGLARIRIEDYVQRRPFFRAAVRVVPEREQRTREVEALMRSAMGQVQKLVQAAPYLPDELVATAAAIDDPTRLVYFIASIIRMPVADRQAILELDDTEAKLRKVVQLLGRELELLELGGKISSQVQTEMTKAQREFFLREQLKAIQRELGETDERTAELAELRERLEKARLPEEAQKAAERELKRLERLNPASPEYPVARTYLEWLADLPWSVSTEDNLDLARAQQVLDEDHYDLEEVKERIVEYLAVLKLRPDHKGPILCFVGPPGVGKTSLGQSIARALGRKFVRMSLGGMRDEAEIRGHRRTYVGALPGRILQLLRTAGSNNPVMMLDEVDKIGTDFRGDPASALLEVLDPAQNHAFRDHYLEVPFDLSRILFIATANSTEPIPPALLDRMEVLRLSGYTLEEKIHIARRYLIPRQTREHGLPEGALVIDDDALRHIIAAYTREAGVRNLERQIARIARKLARALATDGTVKRPVTKADLPELLGPERVFPEVAARTARPGVATGLAWTETGGDILFIEATRMPGGKNLILTGSLGTVMQESARTALSLVRSRARELGIDERFFETTDIHIHVPAGAIPKDGPSAGVAMVVALASVLTGRPVKPTVAMTGEITLSGLVLPVGGIKEKVLAAKRAGIETVILPKRNERDLAEIPEELKRGLAFHLIETVDEALAVALTEPQAAWPAAVGAAGR
ncbi:MAG TPA: endopeptidase La [Thermodesulfobacteriota bacterium]|nr:endopeptidase La [Thermodesulfobacteriota bacterium]